jgi:hypothetical protein
MSYPEEQFDDVRRLLRCKRYEQPPPAYYNAFSDTVIARLEAEETTANSSWWSRLVERFDAKPVVVCAYGVAASGLLFFGFSLSQAFESELAANAAMSGPWLATTPGSSILFPQVNQVAPSEAPAGFLLAGPRSLFRENSAHSLGPAGSLHVQPASYMMHAP